MGVADSLGRALRLPADAVTDLPIIRAVGGREVTIENHKGIIAYTKDAARVRVKGGSVVVRGAALIISAFHAQSVVIRGAISNIEFGN